MSLPSTAPEAIHWVGDAPTSLHGNGAASFNRTTREPAQITCGLCRTLLARAVMAEESYVDPLEDELFSPGRVSS